MARVKVVFMHHSQLPLIPERHSSALTGLNAGYCTYSPLPEYLGLYWSLKSAKASSIWSIFNKLWYFEGFQRVRDIRAFCAGCARRPTLLCGRYFYPSFHSGMAKPTAFWKWSVGQRITFIIFWTLLPENPKQLRLWSTKTVLTVAGALKTETQGEGLNLIAQVSILCSICMSHTTLVKERKPDKENHMKNSNRVVLCPSLLTQLNHSDEKALSINDWNRKGKTFWSTFIFPRGSICNIVAIISKQNPHASMGSRKKVSF